MDAQEFSKIMATLATTYDKPVTPERNKIYFECLKDIDYKVCGLAIQQIIMTSNFFPTVAQIREKSIEISNQTISTSSMDAIGVLNKVMSMYGRYQAEEAMQYIKEQDEILYRIVKAIGFRNVCDADLQRFRTEIEILYRESVKSVKEQAMLSGEVMEKISKLSGKMADNALLLNSDNYY